MKNRAITAVASLLFLMIPAVQAGIITSPVSATATSTWSSTYDIGNTIDQSGLSSLFTSGVTDFDTYLGGSPTHTLLADNNEWFSANGVTSATVIYDMGSVLSIDRLALWNEEFSGFGTGLLSASLDGVVYSVLSSINPVDSPSNLDYGAQVFNLGLVSARYFQLDVSGCPQPDGSSSQICGIGEVAFSVVRSTQQVPEPSVILLFGAGLLGIGYRRKKRM